jgi:hypothetical protein
MAVTVIVLYSRILDPSLEDIDDELDCCPTAVVAVVVEVGRTLINEYCSYGSQLSTLDCAVSTMLGGGDLVGWTPTSDVVENGRVILDVYKLFRVDDAFDNAVELL